MIRSSVSPSKDIINSCRFCRASHEDDYMYKLMISI